MMNTFFLFDLDGTITREELLPRIAREAGLEEEMETLTRLTIEGFIDFESSFKLRFHLLRHVGVAHVQRSIAGATLDPHIEKFIHAKRECCAVVSGNLDIWIAPILERLGCTAYTSVSRCVKEGELELVSILDKGKVARKMSVPGRNIVAVGESTNDISLFEEAHTRVAFGGVHEPVDALKRISDFIVYDGATLCRLLNTL